MVKIGANIQNVGDSISGLFSSGKVVQYSTLRANINNFSDLNAVRKNWNKSLPYGFGVSLDSSSWEGMSGGSHSFSDFMLPLNPQNISQTEEFSIGIRPTQRGTVVSHNGVKYKTLKISGTTGLAPFKGVGGVYGETGKAIAQPNTLKSCSGFEVFLEFRNWLKAYYEYKKNAKSAEAKKVQLVWKNYKDGEFLLVEIISFTMDRSVGFLYNYNIEAKILGAVAVVTQESSFLESLDATITKALDYIKYARGVLLRISDMINSTIGAITGVVNDALLQISLALKAGIGIATTLMDCTNDVLKTFSVNNVKGVLKSVEPAMKQLAQSNKATRATWERLYGNSDNYVEKVGAAKGLSSLKNNMDLVSTGDFPPEALVALDKSQTTASNLSREFYKDTLAKVRKAKQDFEDYLKLGSSFYDTLFDLSNSSSVTKDADYSDFEILDALLQAEIGILLILSTTDFFKKTFQDRIDILNNEFAYIVASNTEAIIQIILPSKTDLERLAVQYLGDSSKWVTIAELNKLKAPYITQDLNSTLSGVAKPGDTLMIPSTSARGFGNLPNTADIPGTVNLSQNEKKLGVDLKITETGDLALGNNGDINFTTGIETIKQAILLKLTYEKGELMKYPNLGVSTLIGSKVVNAQDVKNMINSSLLQDPRIDKIINLSVDLQGNTYQVYFEVIVKNYDTPIPVNFTL